MRLFIAIRFSEAILEALWYIENQLCQQALSGNFTRKENFHLTLSFLGDVTEVDAILQVMDQVKLPAFPLRLEGIGCFCQEKGGDILWAGVREPALGLCRRASAGGGGRRAGHRPGRKPPLPVSGRAPAGHQRQAAHRHAISLEVRTPIWTCAFPPRPGS